MITEPQQVDKPWGHELILERNERFVIKQIFIAAGHRSSLQSHEHKREWVRVESGSLELTTGEDVASLESHVLTAGDVYRVPPRLIHRVLALEDVTVLEVASPPSDDDIVRYSDDYGRGR
ncbi:cupin domain-containing protein [Baekduia sp. Peel2402]|uniref:cupin domain-containing protein n=1 Tax=Baekduia sp. Peel2402 TaxID=3458296 RepID=UPI00403E3B52